MKVQVFHLFFKPDGDRGLIPVDEHLYSLAVEYASQYINRPIEFRDYKNTWVACEVDHDGKPTRALGILSMWMVVDFPLCRFTDNAAVVKLVQRANDHLHDVYGMRGGAAFVYHLDDAPPESRCPHDNDWIKLYGLEPAHRYLIKVR